MCQSHTEIWDAITTAERRHKWLRDQVVATLGDELGSLQTLVGQLQRQVDDLSDQLRILRLDLD